MKKLFYLLVPAKGVFKKDENDLFKTVAFIMFLFISVFCYSASASTNLKAVEIMFSDYPAIVRYTSYFFAVTIDLLVQVFYITAFVSLLTARTVRTNRELKKIIESYKNEYKSFFARLVVCSVLFSILSAGLVFMTYKLSRNGAEQWANSYSKEKYSPTFSFTEFSFKQDSIKNHRLLQANKNFARSLSILENEREIAKKEINQKWINMPNSSNKKWVIRARDLKGRAKLDSIGAAINSLNNHFLSEKKMIASDTVLVRDKRIEYENEMSELKDRGALLVSISRIGVNVWSVANILTLVIISILTFSTYCNEAYFFIRDWVKELSKNNKSISNEILGISEDINKMVAQRKKDSEEITNSIRVGDTKYDSYLINKPNSVRVLELHYPEMSYRTILSKFGDEIEAKSISTLKDIYDSIVEKKGLVLVD